MFNLLYIKHAISKNMKKNTFTLVLMLILFALTGYGHTNQNLNPFLNIWGTDDFISKEGRFSVTPPSGYPKFVHEVNNRPSDAGTLEIHQYSSDKERSTCMVAYYDLPQSLFQSKSIEQMLKDGRDGAVSGGTLEKEKAITVNGYSGLSVYVTVANGGKTIYARSDFVIAKPRMYNYLFLSMDESDLYKDDVKNFFNSFNIQKN